MEPSRLTTPAVVVLDRVLHGDEPDARAEIRGVTPVVGVGERLDRVGNRLDGVAISPWSASPGR